MIFCGCSIVGSNPENRTSIPEPYSAQEKETSNVVHTTSDCRAGEKISQAEVFGVSGTGLFSQSVEDDWCSSQNLVSKSTYQVEVSESKIITKKTNKIIIIIAMRYWQEWIMFLKIWQGIMQIQYVYVRVGVGGRKNW